MGHGPIDSAGGSSWQRLLAERIAALGAGDEAILATDALTAGLLLDAYPMGAFAMPHGRQTYLWLSPAERAVLTPGTVRVPRSLRRSLRRFTVTIDTVFDEVLARCAHGRPLGWIDSSYEAAYRELFASGHAHSVEVWTETADDAGQWRVAPPSGARLAGGLLCVGVGSLVAGESMFHAERDASKVAEVRTMEMLESRPGGASPAGLLDAQWLTPHLRSLGFTGIPRAEYLSMAAAAADGPDAITAWKDHLASGLPEGR